PPARLDPDHGQVETALTSVYDRGPIGWPTAFSRRASNLGGFFREGTALDAVGRSGPCGSLARARHRRERKQGEAEVRTGGAEGRPGDGHRRTQRPRLQPPRLRRAPERTDEARRHGLGRGIEIGG